MKLHLAGFEKSITESLTDALSVKYQVISEGDELDKDSQFLVVSSTTDANHPLVQLASKLQVTIVSLPELFYQLSLDKQRIVIAGSIGKSSLARCVIHVLAQVNKEFDYVVGNAIQITDAPVIIFEGTADHCSKMDPSPQFLRLNHHIAAITSLTHEFPEIYPTYEKYVREFDRLADATPKGGSLVYCEEDDLVTVIGGKERADVRTFPYSSHEGVVKNGQLSLNGPTGDVMLSEASPHDLQNIGGAKALLKRLSITDDQFYEAIRSFKLS